MSGTHAGPVHPAVPGECGWRWLYSGAHLYCDNRAIPALPGESLLCAEHLIALHHPLPTVGQWIGTKP